MLQRKHQQAVVSPLGDSALITPNSELLNKINFGFREQRITASEMVSINPI
jgi:hypothetical protein